MTTFTHSVSLPTPHPPDSNLWQPPICSLYLWVQFLVLFCFFLYPTYKWNHTVFVFLWLISLSILKFHGVCFWRFQMHFFSIMPYFNGYTVLLLGINYELVLKQSSIIPAGWLVITDLSILLGWLLAGDRFHSIPICVAAYTHIATQSGPTSITSLSWKSGVRFWCLCLAIVSWMLQTQGNIMKLKTELWQMQLRVWCNFVSSTLAKTLEWSFH